MELPKDKKKLRSIITLEQIYNSSEKGYDVKEICGHVFTFLLILFCTDVAVFMATTLLFFIQVYSEHLLQKFDTIQ